MKHIRLYRKDRSDIDYVAKGGIFDLFDNHMKSVFRINDDEYDFICEHTDDDSETSNLLVQEKLTFTEKRKLLSFLQTLLAKYYAQTNN